MVRRTYRKAKCTNIAHDKEEAKDRLINRRQSLTYDYKILLEFENKIMVYIPASHCWVPLAACSSVAATKYAGAICVSSQQTTAFGVWPLFPVFICPQVSCFPLPTGITEDIFARQQKFGPARLNRITDVPSVLYRMQHH